MKFSYVVIIPARGGSKRFPGKNLAELNGKPLIVHSIDYAKSCLINMRIFVTTDDSGIASVARQYGASVISRPDELADDFSPTSLTIQHAAEHILSIHIDFDYIILLQPTNPLRPKSLISEGIHAIETHHYSSLVSVTQSYRKLGQIIDKKYVPYNYKFGQRSQDLDPLYFENGLLYIVSKDMALNGNLVDENTFPMVVDHIFSNIDIDVKEDFDMAEYFSIKYKNGY